MSYSFQMTFIEIPENEIISVCNEIITGRLKDYPWILEKNIWDAPSLKECIPGEASEILYEDSIWRLKDHEWLTKLLYQVKFLYWKKYQLLGILDIDMPYPFSKKYASVIMQDKGNQDYSYRVWSNISVFERIVKEIQELPDEEILGISGSEVLDKEKKDTLAALIEYKRKSRVYETIFEMLDLDSWVWESVSSGGVEYVSGTIQQTPSSNEFDKVEKEFIRIAKENGQFHFFEEKTKENKPLIVETPLGTLKAYASTDPNHPGVYIDLIRSEEEIPLNLVEYCYRSDADTDLPEEEQIISRVWGDSKKEDYTDRIVHRLPK